MVTLLVHFFNHGRFSKTLGTFLEPVTRMNLAKQFIRKKKVNIKEVSESCKNNNDRETNIGMAATQLIQQ